MELNFIRKLWKSSLIFYLATVMLTSSGIHEFVQDYIVSIHIFVIAIVCAWTTLKWYSSGSTGLVINYKSYELLEHKS